MKVKLDSYNIASKLKLIAPHQSLYFLDEHFLQRSYHIVNVGEGRIICLLILIISRRFDSYNKNSLFIYYYIRCFYECRI